MDEETKRRCLEPFFTTKGERGTGLGLAMVYGMVQRHGAAIEIDSAPGRGTTVRLIFPLPPSPPALLPAVPARPASAPLRLLVIDDDQVLLQSLCQTLEADGHQVVAAAGGQAGIEAFRAAAQAGQPFAAVLTDLGMPKVDGYQVAGTIKAMAAGTPVFVLTGWGQLMGQESERSPFVDRLLKQAAKIA